MAFDSTLFQTYNIVTTDYPTAWGYNSVSDSFATVAASGYFNSVINRVATGDKLWVKTATSGLSFSGTFRNNGANVFVDWDNTLRFQTQMADISAASTVYFSVPPAGVIVQTYATQWSAVTSASANITFAIAGTTITAGGFAIPTTGVAGSSYSATPTAANLTDGVKSVSASSDGASSTTAIATLGFKIICPAQI